jgi:hypothetical protein
MRLRVPVSPLQTNRSHVQGPQMLQEGRLPSATPRICKDVPTPPQKNHATQTLPPARTPADDDTPPPPPPKNKGKGKATAESLVSTQREAPTMDDVPIRVKPSRAQLNRERAKKRATYQRAELPVSSTPPP